MPYYEFECGRCGQVFDERRSMSRCSEPATCPGCDAPDAERIMSAVSSFSKGSDGSTKALGGGDACGGCSSGGASCASCKH